MLMNDLYTCRSFKQGDHEFSCQVVFNSGHDVFQEHFPGKPIVPDICMMEIVKELLETQLGKSLWLRDAGNVKLLQITTADVQPMVKISWKEGDNGYNASASFNWNHAPLFKLSGSYENL